MNLVLRESMGAMFYCSDEMIYSRNVPPGKLGALVLNFKLSKQKVSENPRAVQVLNNEQFMWCDPYNAAELCLWPETLAEAHDEECMPIPSCG